MTDYNGIHPGSLFGEHLFSRHIFGGSVDALADKSDPVYFLYRVVGDGARMSELQFLEECRLVSGPEPFSEPWIRDRYGAGAYQVMMTVNGKPPHNVRRFMITPLGHAPVELPAAFVEAVPLDVLQQMLLCAADADNTLSPRLGSSIAGGWMTTVRVLDGVGFSHPWLRLMPVFQEYSDSEIYRAYVAQGVIEDRASLKEHVLCGISMVRVLCEKESTKNWERQAQHRGTWYLWLDDERDPKVVLAPDNGDEALGERYQQYVEAALVDVDWRWAKTAQEASDLVEEFGHPKVMGLDHDLGVGGTAMTFLRWMADQGLHVPAWYVHSANPVGAENIRSFMRSWSKSATATREPEVVHPLATEQLGALRTTLRLDEDADAADEGDADAESDEDVGEGLFFEDDTVDRMKARR